MLILLLFLGGFAPCEQAAEPGLPFTEDFSEDGLRDAAGTEADWSVEEQALLLGQPKRLFGVLRDPGIALGTFETQAVALGDVDGDGDLDVVLGNYLEPDAIVFNAGNGVFGPVASVDPAQNYRTWDVELADTDQDGDLDLVIGTQLSGTHLYVNDGSGAFQHAYRLGSETAALSVVLGDVDGDGDLDLAEGNFESSNRLYRWDSAVGSFTSGAVIGLNGAIHRTTNLALGDLDGDGDLDLVEGNHAQVNYLHLNDGTGAFGSQQRIGDTSHIFETRAISIADMDGDGDLDILEGNFDFRDWIFLNDGTAGFSDRLAPHSTTDTQCVAVGDVDNDGDLDIIDGTDGSNSVYLSNGSPDTRWRTGPDSIEAEWTKAMALGDLDGDGRLDLVAGNQGDPSRVYMNAADANPWSGLDVGDPITDELDFTRDVALGDLDGDGQLDLVAGNDGRNRLYLHRYSFSPWGAVVAEDISVDDADTFAVALGDLDGDGDLDIVAGNGAGVGEKNRWYENTYSKGAGWIGRDISFNARRTRDVRLGDLDGDGDLDLVTGNGGLTAERSRRYLNDGSGGWSGADITLNQHFTRAAALGDVDGDGDLDIVLGTYTVNLLCRNDGTGNFETETQVVPAHEDSTTSVTLGDVDRDGDLDLVAGNLDTGERLYLNDGSGGFTHAADIGAQEGTQDVKLYDVDVDGDLDLIVTAEPIRVWENDGTGTFSDAGPVIDAPYADTMTSLAVGDERLDGTPDLVVGAFWQNWSFQHSQSINSISGGSQANPHPWNRIVGHDLTGDEERTVTMALGDLDRDGDLDVVAGDGDAARPNRVYLNADGRGENWIGQDLSSDTFSTIVVLLGDVDGDGYLDVVTGNTDAPTTLYFNDGAGSFGTGVGVGDVHHTQSAVLTDIDMDGDLDIMLGTWGEPTRMYLNQGSRITWSGEDIFPAHADNTLSIAMGDTDGDGDPDLYTGNRDERERQYINNYGAGGPGGFTYTSTIDNVMSTNFVALGDIDRDGDLDLLTADRVGPTRLYENPGSGQFTFTRNVTDEVWDTRCLALADVDTDGDLDVVAGHRQQPNRVYLGDGTGYFDSVYDITNDAHYTRSISAGDIDGDGQLDLVVGNSGVTGAPEVNRIYRSLPYDTGRGRATSLEVDTEAAPITNALLTTTSILPPGTHADYWLSNDGGIHWHHASEGHRLLFPVPGSDLRWRAELSSASPALSPRIDAIHLDSEALGVPVIGDRVWEDCNGNGLQDDGETGLGPVWVSLYDADGGLLQVQPTNADGSYGLWAFGWGLEHTLRFEAPTGYELTSRDRGASDAEDSDADPSGFTDPFTLTFQEQHSRWDAGMRRTCTPLRLLWLRAGAGGAEPHPTFTFSDPNPPDEVTGYNVYRSPDPSQPALWSLVDFVAVPASQWVDDSGDPGTFYYKVAPYNGDCASCEEGAWQDSDFNVLSNPGFENGASGWESNDPQDLALEWQSPSYPAHSGFGALRLRGFNPETLTLFQEVSARPGQRWVLDCYSRIPFGTILDFETLAEMRIEFLDGAGTIIGTTEERIIIDWSSPDAVWIYNPPVEGTAPGNTATARAMITSYRPTIHPGVILIDDVSLRVVGP